MSDQGRATGWFPAQIKPNSARIALRNLARQGFATFLPMQQETRRARGRFVTGLRALFPGYLFVSLDLTGGDWRAVNSTFGITRLVSVGPRPVPVPDEVIKALMARCDKAGRLVPADGLTPGDKVTVTEGPFADFVARVETTDPDRRVWLLLELMARQARVSVADDQVRPL